MTTVTGLVRNLRSTAAPGSQLRWKYLSAPAIVQTALVSSFEDILSPCNLIGEFSQALTGGNYQLSIDGNDNDKWIVAVPSDNSSYDVGALIISAVNTIPTPPSPAVVPNASSSVAGIVKLVKDGANPKVATGCYRVDDVAELKTIASDASNQMAILSKRLTGQPPFVTWDQTSAVADDPTSFTTIKPNDNPATGRWIPLPY